MQWVQCYCWFYEYLSNEKKLLFISLLDEFINSKKFEGIGIELTDEIKVSIGGWAVLLVLNMPLGINLFRHVDVIFVYPGNHINREDTLGLIKCISYYCEIHLAWGCIRDVDTKKTHEGNSILHEFSHALDFIDRHFNGVPSTLLPKKSLYSWNKVFYGKFFQSMSKEQGEILWQYFELDNWNEFEKDNLSESGVAELFSVSTEKYFENPLERRRYSPNIY